MRRVLLPLFIVCLVYLSDCSPALFAIDPPKRPTDGNGIENMRQGNQAAKKESLIELAKFIIQRVRVAPFNGEELKPKPVGPQEDLETLMVEADRYFRLPTQITPNDVQLQYTRDLGRAIETEVFDVLENGANKLEKVNAMRIFGMAGKLACEDLVPAYLKIITEDKYGPEYKIFAFQGLRNLLLIPDPKNPARPHFISDPVKLSAIYTELDKVITKKHPAKLRPEDALLIQYIRREAVRAMAAIKFSVIRNQRAEMVGKPIWTLLRVASNDKFIAPKDAALPDYGYHILERIEAIIGIASELPDRSINPDLVAYMVNEGLNDIMTYLGKDKSADPRDKQLVPWRTSAARMIDAFKIWKVGLEKMPVAKTPTIATKLIDLLIPKTLTPIEANGVASTPDISPITNFRRDNKPKSTQVLDEDPTTVVTIP